MRTSSVLSCLDSRFRGNDERGGYVLLWEDDSKRFGLTPNGCGVRKLACALIRTKLA